MGTRFRNRWGQVPEYAYKAQSGKKEGDPIARIAVIKDQKNNSIIAISRIKKNTNLALEKKIIAYLMEWASKSKTKLIVPSKVAPADMPEKFIKKERVEVNLHGHPDDKIYSDVLGIGSFPYSGILNDIWVYDGAVEDSTEVHELQRSGTKLWKNFINLIKKVRRKKSVLSIAPVVEDKVEGGDGTLEVKDGKDNFPGGDLHITSPEKGGLSQREKSDIKFVGDNKDLISILLKENKDDILLRVPIEIVESMGQENIRNFFNDFQCGNSKGYIELFYASGKDAVNEDIHQIYGLRKKPSDFEPEKENTITLMPVFKSEISTDKEQARKDVEYLVATRIGNLQHKETQVIPVGYQYDTAGLIRGAVLGFVMMHIAREKNKGKRIEQELLKNRFIKSIFNFYSPEEIENVDLKIQDIIDFATGDINKLTTVLKKLIDLLPVDPIDSRQIYEQTRQVWIAV